jgi:hypothetical protein
MAWRRKKMATTPPPGKRAKTPPSSEGARQVLLPDGTIEEWSAATGHSIIVPGTPARPVLDVRAGALGWEGWQAFRWRLR